MTPWKGSGASAFSGLAVLALVTGTPGTRRTPPPPAWISEAEKQRDHAWQLSYLLERAELKRKRAQEEYDASPTSYAAAAKLAFALECLHWRARIFVRDLHQDPTLPCGIPSPDSIAALGDEALKLAPSPAEKARCLSLIRRARYLAQANEETAPADD